MGQSPLALRRECLREHPRLSAIDAVAPQVELDEVLALEPRAFSRNRISAANHAALSAPSSQTIFVFALD